MGIATTIKAAKVLVKNRTHLGFDNMGECIAFFTTLIPPLNMLLALTCKAICKIQNTALLNFYTKMLSHGFGFGALRNMDPETKQRIQLFIQNKQNSSLAEPFTQSASVEVQAIVDDIKRQGYAKLPWVFSADEVEAFLRYCSDALYFSSQTPMHSDFMLRKGFMDFAPDERVAADKRYRCLQPFAGSELPFIKNFLNSPLVQGISASYLQEAPFMYSSNTFLSRAGIGEHYVMRTHRDYDGFNTLTFFIGWTETSQDDGATLFIPESHRTSNPASSAMVPLHCKAGEVYVVDTFGLHCGNSNIKKPRLASWIRFGSLPNLSNTQESPYRVLKIGQQKTA